MKLHAAVFIAGLPAAALAGCAGPPREQGLRGILLPAAEVLGDGAAATNLSGLKASGFNAVIAAVDDETTGEAIAALEASAAEAEIPLHLWFNVGRSRRLADTRPEWIGGMGSHEDWRLRYPGAPHPREGERIGVYPWVPIRYQAVFEDRLAAIEKLLAGRTEGIEAVFLHGLQAPPSACGCGNDQCRWTVDYGMPGGPRKVEGTAPAAFLSALRESLPGVRWVPVWVTECELTDQEEGGTGYCGGVHCYDGLCWEASTAELEAVTREVDSGDEEEGPIALLLAESAFRRNLPRYGRTGGWITAAIRLLSTVPPAHGHAPVPPDRIIAVVEGTRGGADERAAVIQAIAAGVRGVIIAKMPLEEGWEPRILPATPAR
jgi:hypothetical protein